MHAATVQAARSRSTLASPPGEPVLGHGRAFGRDPLGFLERTRREYGDVVPLRFGPNRLVLVNDPHLVEEVLLTQHKRFAKSLAFRRIRPVVGNGLLTSEGDFWLRQRRLAQPAFHRQRIAAYGETMVAYTERLLAAWTDGSVRDVHQDMMALTLEIVARTLFDADVHDDVAAFGRAVATAFEHFQRRVTSLWVLAPDWFPVPGWRAAHQAIRQLDHVVYRVIAERRASGRDRGDLLSLLLQAQDEDGSRMTDRQLRDEAMTLILAGHETTALALSWALYLLSQHPGVETALAAELDGALGGRRPTVADVPRLAYTGQVVAETLRLYPPAWSVGRAALQDVRLGQHVLARGTIALLSQYTLHRHPRWYDDPDAFRPERWAASEALAQRLPRFAYFPFGGGPRQCIGNQFALMEATLILATIVQRYRLTLDPPDFPVVPHPSITLRPRYGIRMRLHVRAESLRER